MVLCSNFVIYLSHVCIRFLGSDVDNFQDEEYPLKMVKDIFNEITNATSIPVIDHEPDSDASGN